MDKALEGRKNLISGANKEDYHVKNITPGETFQPTAYADLRSVDRRRSLSELRRCLCASIRPSKSDTSSSSATSTPTSMGARVLDKNGKEVTPIMGSYGIGIERILTAAIEQSNDENGFWLPPSDCAV